MARLDVEEATARERAPDGPTPAETIEYLSNLPALWDGAEGTGRKLLAEALFDRIEVLGLQEATVHLSQHAVRHGLAAALPEEFGISVNGRGERTRPDKPDLRLLPAQVRDELRGRPNRHLARQRGEVHVTRNQDSTLTRSQGDEVVIARVFGTHGRRSAGIVGELRRAAEPVNERVGVCRRYPPRELRIGKRTPDLGEQHRRNDQIVGACLPCEKKSGRGAPRRNHGGDQDVGIEDCAHRARQPRVRCWASVASASASSSSRSFVAHRRSSRSRPRSRRSASSITSLSPLPSLAARTLTARRTSGSIVRVVRTFVIDAS